MQNHEGAQGTFLELRVITQAYKLFIHDMSGEREAGSNSRSLSLQDSWNLASIFKASRNHLKHFKQGYDMVNFAC